MAQQQFATSAPDFWEDVEPDMPFLDRRHRAALERLDHAFRDGQPLAMLVGDGKNETSHLTRCFLASIGQDVALARISEPCDNAIAGMRKIVRAIGFDPKDLGLADLEHILRMFLAFQRSHQRRTIISIEEAEEQGAWLLDSVRRFIELEEQNHFGLMVVLSGRPSINEQLNGTALAAIRDKTGQHIALEPFTLAETREYLRRCLQADGSADISQVFEFGAVTLIHELCMGAPDSVNALYLKAIAIAEQSGAMPITTSTVMDADQKLKSAVEALESEADDADKADALFENSARFVIRLKGRQLRVAPLSRGRTLVGRSSVCDVYLPGKLISRHHALIVKSSKGVRLLDLGSTNGTSVQGRGIRDHTLQDGDVVEIGDYKLIYRTPAG